MIKNDCERSVFSSSAVEHNGRTARRGSNNTTKSNKSRLTTAKKSRFWCRRILIRLSSMTLSFILIFYFSSQQRRTWSKLKVELSDLELPEQPPFYGEKAPYYIVNTPNKKYPQNVLLRAFNHTSSESDVLSFQADENDNKPKDIGGQRQYNIRLDSYYYEKNDHQRHHHSLNYKKLKRDDVDERMCTYCETWQQTSHPTCNLIHEVSDFLPYNNTRSGTSYSSHHYGAKLLGQGGWRGAWELMDIQDSVVLKTVRFESRYFDVDVYHRHVTDAIVTEKLHEVEVLQQRRMDKHTLAPYDSSSQQTHHHHVVNIYGYCGHAVLNEFANMTLETFIKRHRMKTKDSHKKTVVTYTLSPIERLQYATQVAIAVANLHNADGIDKNTTIVHKDLKPDNLVVVPLTKAAATTTTELQNLTGTDSTSRSNSSNSSLLDKNRNSGYIVKFSDFNSAKLLLWNTTSNNSTCHFRRPMRMSLYRSPEEMWTRDLNERIDVYALGGIIYFILTAKDPYAGKSRTEASKEAAFGRVPNATQTLLIEEGTTRPTLLTHPAANVMIKAIDMAHTYNPQERPSSLEIRNLLQNTLNALKAR